MAPAEATNKNITWSSSNEAVATVDSTGLVTAVAPGSATITVTTEDGSFTDTCAVTVNAATVDISEATITAIADQTYTGSEITPEPVVTLGATTLVKDTDYTVAYAENTNVGTATLTITGTGAYTGTKSATFQIVKATPAVDTWPTASAITLGQALSASTLSGGSGSVRRHLRLHRSHASSRPRLATYSAGVTFTPTDTTNYATVAGTVDVTVNDTGLATVYLNGASGLDTNDGTTAAKAVKTFAKARSLLSLVNGTIYITGQMTITGTETWDLSGYTNAKVMRTVGYNSYLVRVNSGGILTLSNITIDGNAANQPGSSLIYVNSGAVTMNDGTVLQNSQSTSSSYAAGVRVTSGSLTMNGGRIINNTCTSTNAGGVGVTNATGAFTMNGGEITGNTGGRGGGLYTASSLVTLNGGAIHDNTDTSGLGDGMYVSGASITPSVGSSVSISGTIYLSATTEYLNIIGALASGLTVKSVTPIEGPVVAKGSSYTLTAADQAKFSYDGGGYSFALDTGTNAITLMGVNYAVGTDPALSGGSLTPSATSAMAGATISVTVTSDSGKQLVDESLKYSTDGGTTWTAITDFSFVMPAADVVITAEFEDRPGSLSTVYLNGVSGSDAYSGSAAYPVKTFAQAKDLLSMTNGTIYISGEVTVSDTQTWDLSGYEGAKVMRAAGYEARLVVVSYNTGNLTLSNITIDGNKANVAATRAMVTINGRINGGSYTSPGIVTMQDGAVLQNNANNAVGAGAVFNSGEFIMTGGTITGNSTTQSGGGVGCQYGSFTMTGGEICNNSAGTYGGAVDRANTSGAETFSITGGSIHDNTATTAGSALYLCQTNNIIGTGASITGDIYLHYPSSGDYTNGQLMFTGALVNPLTLVSKAPAEGVVVATGSDYTITTADLAKLTYSGTSWNFGLNTGTNSIYLTETAPPVTGVSLDKSTVSIAAGSTDQLTATVSPANATNKTVNWTSSDAAVATVTSSGLVTAVAVGEADITAATVDGGYQANCRVTVTKGTPTISSWPAASPISLGQALSDSTLIDGVASVPGTFAFTEPSTIPSAGTYAAGVTFTPSDSTSYESVTGSVDVTVNAAAPVLTGLAAQTVTPT